MEITEAYIKRIADAIDVASEDEPDNKALSQELNELSATPKTAAHLIMCCAANAAYYLRKNSGDESGLFSPRFAPEEQGTPHVIAAQVVVSIMNNDIPTAVAIISAEVNKGRLESWKLIEASLQWSRNASRNNVQVKTVDMSPEELMGMIDDGDE
jgi:hypothetical protein